MTAPTVFLFVSALLCVILAVYGYFKRRDAFTMYFIGLMAASAIYAFGYGLELASPDLTRMQWMLRLEYLGIPFLSLTWLGMAWAHLNPNGLRRRAIAILAVPSIATFLAFQTNDAHRLFYTSLELVRAAGLSVAVSNKGPLYWLHIAYLNICIAAGILLFVRAWRQSIRIYRSQALCVLLGSFFPWGFHLFYLVGLSPHGIDLGPFGLTASGVLFAIASFQHGIFDILPVARDLVFDGISEGVIVLNEQNRISDFNRSATRYIEGLSNQSVGKCLDELPSGVAIATLLPSLEAALKQEESPRAEIDLFRSRSQRRFEVRLSTMADRSGAVQCKALLLLDVTEKQLLLEELRRQAQTDPLTGLFNRRQLEIEANRSLLFAKRTGTPLSIAVIDIDHFKSINDAQGHSAGDAALQGVSAQLRARLRATDIVGRIGGDEFVAVLPGTSEAGALSLMNDFKVAVQTGSGITLSIGISELGPRNNDLESLIADADHLLYEAKRTGRDRVASRQRMHVALAV